MKKKKYSYMLLFILILVMGIKVVYAEPSECNAIFGSLSDPNSLRYFINEILQYPKYIVPIIVIGLGTVDFAKAVLAAKEDMMRKAQATFIKRVFIGVAVFFAPVMVDVMMFLTDKILSGASTCSI